MGVSQNRCTLLGVPKIRTNYSILGSILDHVDHILKSKLPKIALLVGNQVAVVGLAFAG